MIPVVVRCGKGKRNVQSRADRLYTSTYINKAIRWAYSVGADPVLILSAKHGLVTGDTMLDPYDVTFNEPYDVHSNPIVVPGVIAEQVKRFALSGPLVTLAGRKYQDALLHGSGGAVCPFNPFADLAAERWGDRREGWQIKLFGEHLGRMPS